MIFKNFTLFPNFKKGHVLEWTLDPVFDEELPYNFVLQAAETPSFSQLHYEIDAGDSTWVLDNMNLKQSFSSGLIYRVKLTTGSGNTHYSQSLAFGSSKENNRRYLMAAEIIRKELLMMRKFVPSEGWLLKRKSFGPRATGNVCPITGIAIADNDNEDYGVGIVGGYYDPLGMMWSIQQGSEDKQQGEDLTGEIKETYDLVIRTIGFPSLHHRDIVVDRGNDFRYSVDKVKTAKFPGTSINIVQTVQMRRIPTTDSIYSIEIPKEYQSVYQRMIS